MSTPTRNKLLELYKLSCNIFSQTFNPNNTRTGASALRGKLKGPALQNYYRSEEAPSLSEFRSNFNEFTLRTREDAHHEKMLKLSS
ncbi:hypothetical protein NADFUDRAFT_46050 [Nadsonia fulvescens var. elongata DSM 6958]|uniref:Uncharacterized protein n=1 Tax=Nadsonia fulvescens var. elongata DSM 6958 TaxID=857566 RepID=A0A1E3PMX1_9ASCO|nr:hypothetical protein NADFUDRAFT_46050 [Nadsonia fulvescens var. elongata DSM 6958]